MSILCKLGFHKFRTTAVNPLPVMLPRYPSPAYIQIRCVRRCCGKKSWWFRENHPCPGRDEPTQQVPA